jgi:hypothetical protein
MWIPIFLGPPRQDADREAALISCTATCGLHNPATPAANQNDALTRKQGSHLFCKPCELFRARRAANDRYDGGSARDHRSPPNPALAKREYTAPDGRRSL